MQIFTSDLSTVTLCRWKPWWRRPDTCPIWPVLYAAILNHLWNVSPSHDATSGQQDTAAAVDSTSPISSIDEDAWSRPSTYALPLLVLVHLLVALSQVWFESMHFMFRCDELSVNAIETAECVFVRPPPHGGRADVVPLIRNHASAPGGAAAGDIIASLPERGRKDCVPLSDRALQAATVRFFFHSAIYELVRRGGAVGWDNLDYPQSAPLGEYVAWRGWSSGAQLAAAAAKWGSNAMQLPVPSFGALFLEHALAPFFVFQVFCVMLWMLDEYWYYSLFTLTTLAGMEALMVFQRITQMTSLRKMRPEPSSVYVYRNGAWSGSQVTADKLVPGDIISLSSVVKQSAVAPPPPPPARPGMPVAKQATKAPASAIAPADCVVLAGCVICNEAMLTGESSPMMKEAVQLDDDVTLTLDAFTSAGSHAHSRYVVHAGTNILQAAPMGSDEDMATLPTTTTTAEGGSGSVSLPAISSPPDAGAIGIVVRTGFDTSQGRLMRTISHASERVTAGTWEALLFIAILLVFAIGASYYVLVHGWEDPTRSKYKLVLHCILIITSVVPPELPIELSLAVNASLATLARRGIFCTEPFRIVFGGLVNTTCFDKTGTLTADEFSVAGVVMHREHAHEGAASTSSSSGGKPTRGGGGGGDVIGESASADLHATGMHLVAPTDTHMPPACIHILAGCHSLMYLAATKAGTGTGASGGESSGNIVGDPMEKAALASIGWTISPASSDSQDSSATATSWQRQIIHPVTTSVVGSSSGGIRGAASNAAANVKVTVLKRWAFSSELKRMSAVICVEGGSGRAPEYKIVTKGAPEVILDCLASLADRQQYIDTYTALTCTGARVLALAHKALPLPEVAGRAVSASGSGRLDSGLVKRHAARMHRSVAESGLQFAGFLVLTSPLKTDSVRTVRELQTARNRVVMITGDAPLTAISVARHTNIVPQLSTSLAQSADAWILEWDFTSASVPPASGGVQTGADAYAPLRWRHMALPGIDVDTCDLSHSDATAATSSARRGVLAALRSLTASSVSGSGSGAIHAQWEPFVCKDGSVRLPPAQALVCVTGPAFAALQALKASPSTAALASDAIGDLVHTVLVFARMSPTQKETIILALNQGSAKYKPEYTLMCGDGTNDVGALKHAHIGVSIISNPGLERKYDAMRLNEQQKKREQRAKLREGKLKLARSMGASESTIAQLMRAEEASEAAQGPLDESDEELSALLKSERGATATTAATASSTGTSSASTEAVVPANGSSTSGLRPESELTPGEKRVQQEAALKAKLAELQAEMMAGGDSGAVALGDASIASPFTSKLPSPIACVEILRQGRCTLVATHQVYRILAINSLVLSYMLSVLYLHGVKTGDSQATISGIAMTTFFMCISWAKPLQKLAPVRPRKSVFNPHLLLSVFGQFLIHLSCLVAAVYLCQPYANLHKPPIESVGVEASNASVTPIPLSPDQLSESVTSLASAMWDEFSTPALPPSQLTGGSEVFGGGYMGGDNPASVLEAMKSAAAGGASESSGQPKVDVKETFFPNVINTVIFLLSTAQQAVTFLVNYTGEPFVQPLRNNKVLLWGVTATVIVCALGATGLVEDLTTALELVELPTTELKVAIMSFILGDALLSVALETGLRKIYGMGDAA